MWERFPCLEWVEGERRGWEEEDDSWWDVVFKCGAWCCGSHPVTKEEEAAHSEDDRKEDKRAWIIHDIIEPPNQPCNLLAPDFLLK